MRGRDITVTRRREDYMTPEATAYLLQQFSAGIRSVTMGGTIYRARWIETLSYRKDRSGG